MNKDTILAVCEEKIKQQPARQAEKQPEPEAWEFRPTDPSDVGNASSFAPWVRDRLRFCKENGWLRYIPDRGIWKRGEDEAISLAEEYTSEMLNDALNKVGRVCRLEEAGTAAVKNSTEYLNFARKSRQLPRVQAILTGSRGALSIDIDKLDAEGDHIKTPSFYINMRMGKRLAHSPNQYCTHSCSIDPSNKGVEIWDRFLDDITCGDGALKGYLQIVAGMAAVGKVLTEKAIFLIGAGRNGKSTWLNAIASVLGDYAGTMPVEVLTTARQQRGAVYAELRGKRLIQAGELEQGARLSVSALKQICSTDRIPCERKYCDPGDFKPTHTVVLMSNYAPRIGADDLGCWRRIAVVPFRADFTGSKEIKNYADVLVEQAGGAILSWVLEGAKAFLASGGKLQEPDTVEDATEEYRASEDWMGRFLEECCETDGGASRTQSSVLHRVYREHAQACGDYPRRIQDFAAALEARGFRKSVVNGTKYWIGIRLLDSVQYRSYA